MEVVLGGLPARSNELEAIIEEIEKNLDVGICEASMPRLLELTSEDDLARTRTYLLAARCYFVARNPERCQAMLELARATAAAGPMEAQFRVSVVEASLLVSSYMVPEAMEKLEFAIAHLSEVSDELRGLAQSIRGRTEALKGAYAEAIEYSQDAVALSAAHSSAASFANGTMAYVFQTLGRFDESEMYMLEQIKILTERGSKQGVAGLYAFLCAGATSQQNWQKAMEYQNKAMELVGDTPEGSALRPVLLSWMANSHLELGDHKQALEYIEEGLKLAKEISNKVFIMNAQILLGEIRFKNKEYEAALEVLQSPLESQEELGDSQRINLYRGLAQTYQALDRKADAFDICYRLWELQRDFDGRTREALLQYHRALEKKIHAQETALLKTKSVALERELSLQAMSMAAQTDLLARFRDDLRMVVREVNDPALAIRKVKDKLKSLPCEQIDWTKFEAQFTSVHPGFATALQEKFPDLSPAEIRLCKLLRLDLKSSEIARLFCLSERTIETQRFAVRRKLGLKREDSIAEVLGSI